MMDLVVIFHRHISSIFAISFRTKTSVQNLENSAYRQTGC